MDFFKAQEKARATSRRLVAGFALSVVGVIATLYLIATLAKAWLLGGRNADPALPDIGWWDPALLMWVAILAGGMILLGSLFKLIQLSSGGGVVARDLGGRPVDPATTDALERRLLNVVEEMAIASGVVMPEVWILENEGGINAFAAGSDPSNAVIGVTRGSLERLGRAELQGVIAHEFSHILNGDMKLNLRLMGWIFGLVMLAMLGRMLIESIRFARPSRDRDGQSMVLAILAAGAAVWLVGSVGVLFARLMQAAISRQREFLADASAVQFTRDPSGIAGALKKIGGFAQHGSLQAAKASEARHMFFAKSELASLALATHPPLEARIRAIDPFWDGKLIEPRRETVSSAEATGFAPGRVLPPPPLKRWNPVDEVDVRVGQGIRHHLVESGLAIASKDEAKAAIYGLFLSEDLQGGAARLLAERTHSGTAEAARSWAGRLARIPFGERLAFIDLSLAWLRKMSRDEAEAFLGLNRALIETDGETSLMEFMLENVMERHVAIAAGLRGLPKIHHTSLPQVADGLKVLLESFAALAGDAGSVDAARRKFFRLTGRSLEEIETRVIDLVRLEKAFAELEQASPSVKVAVLDLCGSVVFADGEMSDEEAQMLRAVADAIGAPLPPALSAT